MQYILALQAKIAFFEIIYLVIDYSLKFKELRKQLSLTQVQLGEGISVSRSVISQIEIGKFKPTLEVIESIARIYNIDPVYFFADSEPKKSSISNSGSNETSCSRCAEKERIISTLREAISAHEKTIKAQEMLLDLLKSNNKQTGT
jgi:transcriptional regulator with XRE-family HTH domain